jgi:hypothetical protein
MTWQPRTSAAVAAAVAGAESAGSRRRKRH